MWKKKTKETYKYIYGPVSSWRLGRSLGIDVLSAEKKVCTFDCLYCQIGRTGIFTDQRKIFVPTREIIKELDSFPKVEVDYITFSGSGEPTLASNLGELITAVKKKRKAKVAVLTNSSLIDREDVQADLMKADLVSAKLDACSQDLFQRVDRPVRAIQFMELVDSLKKFKSAFKGQLTLQIMFIHDNKSYAGEIAKIANSVKPDEIQLNTPLRPCAVKPLKEEEMEQIKKIFQQNCPGIKIVSVYEAEKKEVKAVVEADVEKRRGKHEE